MRASRKAWMLLGALGPLLAAGVASAAGSPVTVECSLKVNYRVHTELPSVDAVNRYSCTGKITASSDVDAVDPANRQVVFGLDQCRRLPPTVVFGGRDVTEVRELRGDRTRAHLMAGECRGCAMAASTGIIDPRLDAGHFDGRFVVKPLDRTRPDGPVMLPAGKGRLTLRSEQTDRIIVRAEWVARRCTLTPPPPIFCGGIAGLPCPGGMRCVDWPGDDCDPGAGGADCIGMCVEGSS